jgi:predicted 3-demethylubiquinone-9 3-methyltransferase (glyoxalase superfamily)
MQSIAPCLWFDTEAEEAARFYTSLFPNSRVTHVSHYGEAGPRPAGLAMMVLFELDGRPFMALNGGPEQRLTPAFSLSVSCETQEEIDRYWALLADGGQEIACGWVTDRFGLSWQIVPARIGELVGGPDPEGSQRAMRAMMGMVKLDIDALQRAYDGAEAPAAIG